MTRCYDQLSISVFQSVVEHQRLRYGGTYNNNSIVVVVVVR
jgi:hypothetical protein